jgi:hypothetical protein
VCAIAFTGANRFEQWPGSRVISAQKANTVSAFNLPGGTRGVVDALSTANLWTATQPGGSLFGLQFSNPVNINASYGSNTPTNPFTTAVPGGDNYGMVVDPLVGQFVGGVNVFGGGLAAYIVGGWKAGGIGVSGDTSCADHNISWRVRNTLGLDNLTSGAVGGLGAAGHEDNINYDLDSSVKSASRFGHPACGFGEDAIASTLPATR